MPQTTDIVLAGDGYMLVPGAYHRQTDGAAEGAPGVIVQRDFVGGQRRAIHLESERGWDSEGVGPVLFGQAVEPWPFNTSYADATIAAPTTTQPIPAMLLGDAIYIGIGRFLYQSVSLSASAWSDFTQVADIGSGNVISCLAPYAANLAVACGSTHDIQIYDPALGTLTTLQAGERGTDIVGYANQLVWADATAAGTGRLRLTTGAGIDTREFDSAIARLALHDGRIAIATRTSLAMLGGKPDATTGLWIGDPDPVFTQGAWTGSDDFGTMISFGGKLYAWLGHQLLEWNPNVGANRQGWRAVGIEGLDCFGATVTADWLIVSIRTFAGSGQIWAYDGTGWWLIEAGIIRLWPLALSGAGSFDLLAFRSASTTYDLYRLIHRSSTDNAYRSQGAYRTSLHDAGAPEEHKAWRSIQTFFAAPEDRGNTASTDAVDLTINYSLDGGRTWVTHATDSVGGTVDRTYDLGGVIVGALPESRYLQVEIAWSSVIDWAPTLTALAIGYERLGPVSKRRRWQMTAIARDRLIERDGGLHPRTPEAIVAGLWTAWANGVTVALRDIDYDTDPTERRVRVVGLSETRPAPAQPGPTSGAITITLVEA